MRMAALVGVFGLVLPILTAVRASAAPELLLGRNRLGEFQAVRGEDFLAWQQNTKKHPETLRRLRTTDLGRGRVQGQRGGHQGRQRGDRR